MLNNFSVIAFSGAVNMQPLDIAVFVSYVLVLIIIGTVVTLRNKNSEDLFLGGRSMKWSNIGFSIFGTNIGPTFLIATCGAGYTSGMVTANFEWMAWVFLFLLGMVFVPFYLNTKISTMPEFMMKRFGNGCYTFMSFYSLLGTVVLWIGGTLFAGGALLSQLLGWSLLTSVLILTLLSVGLAVSGGLKAVMVADSLQSSLMILGAALLTIIAGSHIESFDSLRNLQVGAQEAGTTWKLFQGSGSSLPWYAFILGYPVLSIWFWCSDQTIVQKVLGASNLKQAQGGTIFTGLLKILPPFIFLLPGIFAAVLLPGIADDKEVFLIMVNTYLPAGLVGLIVTVLVAAVISTLSAGLNSFATIFTLDIYKRWISPEAPEHKTKQAGQLITIFAAGMAIGIALLLSKAEGTNLFNLFQSIIGYMAPPVTVVFVLGIFWKRSTSIAAVTTLIVGSTLSLTVGILDISNYFAVDGKDIWPHFLMLSFYLFIVILILMTIISLLTQHSPHEIPLPTLRETYRQNSGLGPKGFVAWGGVALIMILLYCFFQFVI